MKINEMFHKALKVQFNFILQLHRAGGGGVPSSVNSPRKPGHIF